MMTLEQIVHRDPEILGGTPVFRGTRVPIRSLFDYLEGARPSTSFSANSRRCGGSRPSHYSNSRGKTSRPMRLLPDEHLPISLAAEFPGHAVDTVSGRGWTGIKNGELLRRMNGQYTASMMPSSLST